MSRSKCYNRGENFNLENRLLDFAVSAFIYLKELPHDKSGRYYGNNLRSGGVAVLSFGASQGTYTHKDFINKATICLKELKESRVNLKILNKM